MDNYEFLDASDWLSPSEDALMLLAREQEWAEAYASDNPECAMGRLYLQFLHRELAVALSA